MDCKSNQQQVYTMTTHRDMSLMISVICYFSWRFLIFNFYFIHYVVVSFGQALVQHICHLVKKNALTNSVRNYYIANDLAHLSTSFRNISNIISTHNLYVI